ncbi:hypothetical protein [Labilibacter marinus]|uniref:hypothetical protein n=1 Tax=Labilibacter marinus TaxID=1477105 RepID=UPI00094F5987|nr:hypothetical protein [Labilibacter marinus]
MKKLIIILFALIATSNWANAQFSHLNDVELKTSEDYKEYTEQVLDCSYYLLMTPFDKKDSERTAATEFIIRWMKGSPSCDFSVSDDIKTLTEEKEELIGLYASCYAKVYLENEESTQDITEITEGAVSALIQYCNNPSNKIKPTKEMKKRLG